MKKLIVASLAVASLALTATAAFAAPKYDLDTKIETLVADPAAKKVLDTDLKDPDSGKGITESQYYEMFKSGSLNDLVPMAEGAGKPIPKPVMDKVKADLAALGDK